MTKIPMQERILMENSIYLPLVIKVLHLDLTTDERSPFKLKKPYVTLLDETLKNVQRDLAKVKAEMKQQKLKVVQLSRDEAFTQFLFIYKGYEEQHNYFNPRLRNKVQELVESYFLKKKEA